MDTSAKIISGVKQYKVNLKGETLQQQKTKTKWPQLGPQTTLFRRRSTLVNGLIFPLKVQTKANISPRRNIVLLLFEAQNISGIKLTIYIG